MSAHLGTELAALVDGELGHVARERVLRHLVRCAGCRAEVEAQRRLKARMLGLSDTAPAPAADLTARLCAVAVGPAAGECPAGLLLGVFRGSRATDPAARPAPLPRAAVGGTVVLLGLGALLALSGAHRAAPVRVPGDPSVEATLVEYARSTTVPLPEPVGVARR